MRLENLILRLLKTDIKGIEYLDYAVSSGIPTEVAIENWLIFFLNKRLNFPTESISLQLIDFLVGKLQIKYDYLWENLKPFIKGD